MRIRQKLLLGVTGLNAALLALAFGLSIETTPIEVPVRLPPLSGDTNATASPSNDQLTEISRRPIMSPTRRPYVAPKVEVQPEEVILETEVDPAILMDPPMLELMGVEISGAGRSALLFSPDRQEAMWVKLGEELLSWQVVEITEGSVGLKPVGSSATPTASITLYKEGAPCEGC